MIFFKRILAIFEFLVVPSFIVIYFYENKITLKESIVVTFSEWKTLFWDKNYDITKTMDYYIENKKFHNGI